MLLRQNPENLPTTSSTFYDSEPFTTLTCSDFHSTLVWVGLVIRSTNRSVLKSASRVTNTHSCTILELTSVTLVTAKADGTWVK